MVGVRIELALELGVGLDFDDVALRIGVGFVAGESVDLGEFLLAVLHDQAQAAEHVVEGPVFHHENDDVLQIVQSDRHGTPVMKNESGCFC